MSTLPIKDVYRNASQLYGSMEIAFGWFSRCHCWLLGDYYAGLNHVLPTAHIARFSSLLGVYDFIKHSGMIEVMRQTLGKVVSTLAYGEGLQAHARTAEMRLKKQAINID